MINTILTERLAALYDPFSVLWDTDLLPIEKIKEQIANCDIETVYIDDLDNRDGNYHAGRCKYFTDMYTKGKKVDPILVDCVCSGSHVLPSPIVLDGHHRLIGAILSGTKKIKVSFGGRVDLLHYLQGRRKTCPQE